MRSEAKGRAEDKAEGLAEGKAEGRAEGEAKARAELIAQSIEGLRNAGLTDEVIAHRSSSPPRRSSVICRLMTDDTPTAGDEAMNDTTNRVPQYHVPENASEEARAWIQRAQERLERFAAQPDQRRAYEHELLERINHNTLMHEYHEEGFSEGKAKGRAEGKAEGLAEGRAEGEAKGRAVGLAEGEAKGEAKVRAELIAQSVEGLRNAGLTDELIAQSLKLTPEEIERYVSSSS